MGTRSAILAVGEDLEGSGGMARMAGFQRQALQELGWEVTPVTPACIGRPRRSRKFPALNTAFLSWQIGTQARALSRRGGVIFSHGMCGAAGASGAQVHLYHGTYAGLAAACRPRLSALEYAILRWVNGALEARGGRAASTVLAVSALVAEEIKRVYRVPRSRILYDAVDTGHFRPAANSTRTRPAGASFVGLCVGRMDYGKGRETLRLLGPLLPADYRVRLAAPVVQGDAQWPEGRTEVLGAVSYADLPAAYHAADYLLCVSRYEGFGLTMLEAWACGIPVVTANVGIIREMCVLQPALRDLVVEDPDDAAGFAACIRRLRENPEIGRRQAEWGRQVTEERFSLVRMREDYRQLLPALLD